ncbi:MAG: hypothetical protein ACI865_002411 [Flavobacteriaceae bacterium]|jgi:hypothetical protein
MPSNTAGINLSDKEAVKSLSERLGCTELILRHCLSQVGASEPAIEAYWSMNKDRLESQESNATLTMAH